MCMCNADEFKSNLCQHDTDQDHIKCGLAVSMQKYFNALLECLQTGKIVFSMKYAVISL